MFGPKLLIGVDVLVPSCKNLDVYASMCAPMNVAPCYTIKKRRDEKELSFSVRGRGKQQVRRFKCTVNHLSCRESPCCSSSAGKYHFLRGKSITEVGETSSFVFITPHSQLGNQWREKSHPLCRSTGCSVWLLDGCFWWPSENVRCGWATWRNGKRLPHLVNCFSHIALLFLHR